MTKIEEISDKYRSRIDITKFVMNSDEFQKAAEELLKPLESKIVELKKQLEKASDKAYTDEADFRLLQSENVELKKQLEKSQDKLGKTEYYCHYLQITNNRQNLYAELGRLFYNQKWVEITDYDNWEEMYKIVDQIKEMEAGNEKP